MRDLDAYSAFSARAGRHIRGPQGLPLVKPRTAASRRLTSTAVSICGGPQWARGRSITRRSRASTCRIWAGTTAPSSWPRRISCWLLPRTRTRLADAGRDYFVDRDAYLRAYELSSGEEIGRVELPSNAYGAPMSYTAGVVSSWSYRWATLKVGLGVRPS